LPPAFLARCPNPPPAPPERTFARRTPPIPPPLRPAADGQATVEGAGSTVAEVLADVGRSYPELHKKLFAADGELHQYVNVFVNDEDIRFMDELETPVKDADEIGIIPAIAGG
jgi:molybdopterin synthase sulfur carrier subunit